MADCMAIRSDSSAERSLRTTAAAASTLFTGTLGMLGMSWYPLVGVQIGIRPQDIASRIVVGFASASPTVSRRSNPATRSLPARDAKSTNPRLARPGMGLVPVPIQAKSTSGRRAAISDRNGVFLYRAV